MIFLVVYVCLFTGGTCTGHHPSPFLPDMFQFVHYVAYTVGKRAVGIRLKCLLVDSEYLQLRPLYIDPNNRSLGTYGSFEITVPEIQRNAPILIFKFRIEKWTYSCTYYYYRCSFAGWISSACCVHFTQV